MSIRITVKRDTVKWASVVVVGLALVGLYWASEKAKNTAAEQANSLQAAFIQNLIILDTGSQIDISSPRAAEEHRTLHAKLEQNINDLERLYIRVSGELAPLLRSVIKEEKLILATYAHKLDVLAKALEYNPSEDLDVLNFHNSPSELLARVTSAKKGLQAIQAKTTVESSTQKNINAASNLIKLDQQSSRLLAESIRCFSDLELSIQNGLVEQALGNKQACIDSYGSTRETLNKNLISTINSDAAKRQQKIVRSAVNDLKVNN